MATFGDKIRAIREDRGLTQDSLAALLNTTKQVISLYELGRRTPKIDMAERYAAKLMVPVNYLVDNSLPVSPSPESWILGLTDKMREEKTAVQSDDGLSPMDAKLLEYLKRLSEDQKKFLLAQIETLLKSQE